MDTISNLNNNITNSVNGFTMDSSKFSILIVFLIIFVLFIISYFLSKSFRLAKTKTVLNIYPKYQNITSFNYDKYDKLKFRDIQLASSHNSTLIGYQKFDYTSSEILLNLLKVGVRYFEFNIFNSKFGINAIPVVSNGYAKGEWKMTVNTSTFKECMKILSENAFKLNRGDNIGVNNPDDPLIIGLNLSTNNNIFTLDIVNDVIIDYFRTRLMNNKYGFQQQNIGDIPLKDMKGKLVILSSNGFEGSKLEEIINYSWDMDGLQRIHYSDLNEDLIEYNKKNITIVVPNKEGDFYSENYNPVEAFEYGCQLVSMNYQNVDSGIDKYITKFKEKSVIIKPKILRN